MKFYVAPEGRDDWTGEIAQAADGAQDGPFATLARARDAVRAWRRAQPSDAVEVVLRGGTHRLEEPLVLGMEDGGARERPIVWRAFEGETPVLSGGVEVTGWQPLTDEPAHLHPAARGKVWVADLPAQASVPRTLYADGRRLPRARGVGFARLPMPDDDAGDPRQRFAVPQGAIAAWPDLAHAEVVVIPKNTWTMNILPLAAYDAATGIAETTVPCTYPLAPNKRAENTWAENTLAVLREPGMWVCDPQNRRLYLWPEDETPPRGLTVPATTELLRIEGEPHPGAGADHPVEGIVLRGLVFTQADRYPWHGRTGRGLQHDWDMHDAPTALLRLRTASYCSVEQCVFRDSGGGGLRIDLHAGGNRVAGCSFARLGATAVTLAGYGLGTKDVNRGNTVVNTHIREIGQIYWHSPAIFVWQSGANRIAHNHIEQTPYTAIVCSGRTHRDRQGNGECSALIRWDEVDALLGADYPCDPWHQAWYDDWRRREPLMHSRDNRIEYNDISQVMQIMGDGNGIYISGAGGGNIVRHNHIHDCPSPSMSEGIRCDDDQHDTLIQSNLVHRLGGMATGITIKGLNAILDNIVACPLVEQTARAMISLEVGPLHGNPIRRNIVYTTRPEQRFYHQTRLRCHGEGPDPLVRDCQADDNIYWCTAAPETAEAHLAREQAHGTEMRSRATDPGFVDPEAGDFRLRPDSPLHELDIALPQTDAAGPIPQYPMPD
ncbi:MAG: right-handed parallel beta-helix repeat-containing protein, partial [Verrucomicrobiota bacterium]